MFDPELHVASAAHRRIFRSYEQALTAIDLAAALAFVVGSIFFFYPALEFAGTWFFLVGSILFAVRPLLRFGREFHLGRLPLPGESES